jgi:phosphoribosylformylglycinamidine (FGAM) synthase PurS component
VNKTHIVEVSNKAEFRDSEGYSTLNLLSSILPGKIELVNFSRLYKLEGDFSASDVEKISQNILCDAVTENFSLHEVNKKGFYKVCVWLKPSASDVVGESVLEIAHRKGFKSLTSIRCGSGYFVKTKMSKQELEKLVKNTLVNPIINTFTILGKNRL